MLEKESNFNYNLNFVDANKQKNRAQVSIFIILAIVIFVVAFVLFFVFRENIFERSVPQEISPVYSYYLSCIEEELDTFLDERIDNCDFSEFREKGFNITISDSEVKSVISENVIILSVNQPISISFGDLRWSKTNHDVNIDSNLGKLYDVSNEIYKKEKEESFLEDYGVDVLRLYAPVDGSEISCSPKIWEMDNVRNELLTSLEGNVPALKIRGNYYDLNEEENKYFITDIDKDIEDVNVNFLFSRNFPYKIEAYPNEGGILRADPIGLQEGLGALGFCYVPYHFVYDIYYPVLIQVYSGNEIFQFPVVVVIDKNKPRESIGAISPPGVVPELCQYKNTRISVYTYNNHLEPINADISFKCFDTTCGIGTTNIQNNDAVLIDNFPQCINGSIIAESAGYETTKFRVTSLNQTSAVIVMKPVYNLEIDVRSSNSLIDGKGEYALVSFTKDNSTKTISYPEQKEISLSEGQYEIKVYVYRDSNITISGSVTEKCIDIPKSGFFGVLGQTEEKCFDLDIPGQVLSYAVYGGGKENYYISESELENSNKLSINSEGFSLPRKIEDLQLNYNRVENSGLDIRFI